MGTKHYPLLSARAILLAMLALMSWCQPALATQGSFTGLFKSALSSKKDRMESVKWWFKKSYKQFLYWFR